MTKQETIDYIIPTQSYVGSAIRKLITDIEEDTTTRFCPEYFKKSDVIRICAPKNKPRPSVIIKVTSEYVISIPLTTSESIHCLAESKSRFFKDGCFTNSYEITPIEIARESFLGVYDNPKLLNAAIKELREFIKKNI